MANKYHAKRTTLDGITFSSKGESLRYAYLKQREKAKEISALTLQPRMPIFIEGKKVCDVVLDFQYFDRKRNKTIYEDYKGMDNALSKLKRKLCEAYYQIDVEVIRHAYA